ncbi:MAG: hypothetical protein WC291_00255 [Thermodesulfovibrionales bacterium]|jgi:hypothetical protein
MDSDKALKEFEDLSPDEQTIAVLGRAIGTLTYANDPDRQLTNKLSSYLFDRTEGPMEATSLAGQAGAMAVGAYLERNPGTKGTDREFVDFVGQCMLDTMKIAIGSLEVGGVLKITNEYLELEKSHGGDKLPEELEGATKVDSGKMDDLNGLKQLADGLRRALLQQAGEADDEPENGGEDKNERLN